METEQRFQLERELGDAKIATVVESQKKEHLKTRAAVALSALPTWGPILVSGAGSVIGALGLHHLL